jgi:hypothetical protein
MKLHLFLIATLGIASSVSAWASSGDLFYDANSSSSSWTNTADVPNPGSVSGITLAQDDAVSGYLAYNLEDAGVYYPLVIRVADGRTCLVEGSSVDNEGRIYAASGNVYKVMPAVSSSQGAITCNVSLTLDTAAPEQPKVPQLTLTTYQNVDVVQNICLDTSEQSDLKIKAEQVIPFTIENEQYIAIYVSQYTGQCVGSDLTTANGLHIYKWGTSAANPDKAQYTYKQSLYADKADEFPFVNVKSIEFFSSADGRNNSILVAHQADVNNADSSKISILEWDDGKDKFVNNHENVFSIKDNDAKEDSDVFDAVSSIKHVRSGGLDFIVVGQKGSRLTNYKQFATTHQWDGGEFTGALGRENKVPTMGLHSMTHFEFDGADYLILANKHNEAAYTVDSSTVYFINTNSLNEAPLDDAGLGNTITTTHGVNKWEEADINGKQILLPVNTYYGADAGSSYKIKEWYREGQKGTLGDLANSKPVEFIPGLVDWKHLNVEGQDFFLATTTAGTLQNNTFAWGTDTQGYEGLVKTTDIQIIDSEEVPFTPNISTLGWTDVEIASENYVLRLDNSMNGGVAVQVFIPSVK